ncbi:type II secretion system F family protein [Phycisphaera mikurensis]|uniref:Type IV pilus assembly protein PilC n=1 Tax=Phycisphaera mikurensis (strain NBRC 102666 / KCTC 22515 / FYK2301M01) TaxID=1142394 RepID=I0IHL8_PHYMF|nr:type II secretion system F family protein [Phycisphaera mikurensis]MBB6441001.1 type IV pilus assembly protein PilC [Phycisphaera mikurensis]BAM04756.1 type IV pilus assembly protein PilC [Phycisphaera mikurensis NBRC 102666]
MPLYRYQMKNAGGEVSVGNLKADSAMAASQVLRARGNTVIALAPVAEQGTDWGAKLKALNYTSGPNQNDILGFTTQLAVMVKAGISLRAALEGIAEQVENAKFRKILFAIKGDVEAGKPFSEALKKYPKLFGPLYINMIRASEMSGQFSHMLDRIAAYLTQQIETKRMVTGAMVYPVIIAVMAVAVSMFLLTFVLPKFAAVFEGKESAMPMPTIILMNLSDFMVVWWWAVILGMLSVAAALFFVARTEKGGWWVDALKLKVPVFQRMFKSLYIGRSLHTMGELINAGVPMLDTLQITGEISGNRMFRRLWLNVYNSVKQGKKITTPLHKGELLPKPVIQMISAGEESGKLGEVLEQVSSFYAKQLKETIKTVTSMIEPIMIVVMGGIVGFIAMAIILPIFKLSTLVS